ncbi:23S rRNA (uracil(1939)-C(5))-methyltransferase RlmD [Anaerotalea alkaliphila]|uniref:23S rRNA (Uracil(1939)-C(5))-methyltransferase RlmD n=1 Tax=Anaerotalea alkaliphila TaxID=2662126 RepID=A0A7X5HU18_9FIRM|nr:23S rRNA (uracil(1939)-C(5))-methyltransferase RlmD [Anaerotalea alkaliphila]NDL66667.1 23S rRNA (uracil(1939)-C(5))-methyltransferase RlmD [Anaerotalea alkaliphila]
MKKNTMAAGVVERVAFPNKAVMEIEGVQVQVKNALPGQKVEIRLKKKRKNRWDGEVVKVLEPAPYEIQAPCPVFGVCGGCLYQQMPYGKQLEMKAAQVQELLSSLDTPYPFEGISPSPREYGYRNKMEYSFGDPFKDGPLTLGMHRRGSMHDIVDASDCRIVHPDFNRIVEATTAFFRERGIPFYHKRSHEGWLRYLLLRRGEKTGQLQVNLVTSSQMEVDLAPWVELLGALPLEHALTGVLHTISDTLSDAVKPDSTRVLRGELDFHERLLGLDFRISPFSFFQTNSLGAEVLYGVVQEYVGDMRDKLVYDLYAGTGTITQLLAGVARKAVGVEIVEEAVEAARRNAALNGLEHCEFIAGDVLGVLDSLEEKPDVIVLDPPREGVHHKALEKILRYGVRDIVYVSCKPTSLVEDLKLFLEKGYRLERVRCVDLFPSTPHVETVVLLNKHT